MAVPSPAPRPPCRPLTYHYTEPELKDLNKLCFADIARLQEALARIRRITCPVDPCRCAFNLGGVLHAAASASAPPLDVISYLVEQGADLEWSDTHEYNRSPILVLASSRGNLELMQFLIMLGADPNGGSTRQHAPLHSATNQGNLLAMRILIEAGADVNARRSEQTPLFLAANRGDVDSVRLLLASGADVNATSTLAGSTPLLEAANGGHVDVVQVLVDARALQQADKAGVTPLMRAALKGSLHIVDVLLKAGADVNALSRIAQSAVSIAAAEGEIAVIRRLMEENCSASVLEGALEASCAKVTNIQLLQLLIAAIPRGPNLVSICTKLLSKATFLGKLDLTEILLRAGADPLGVDHFVLTNTVNSYPPYLASFVNLTTLHLSALPDFVFGLSSLTALRITHNPSLVVPLCLSRLESLKTLVLSACGITSLPKTLFCRMSRLQMLDLSSNALRSLPLPPPMACKPTTALAGNFLPFVPHSWCRLLPANIRVQVTSHNGGYCGMSGASVCSLRELAATAMVKSWETYRDVIPSDLQEMLMYEKAQCRCGREFYGKPYAHYKLNSEDVFETLSCSEACYREKEESDRRGRIDLRSPKRYRASREVEPMHDSGT